MLKTTVSLKPEATFHCFGHRSLGPIGCPLINPVERDLTLTHGGGGGPKSLRKKETLFPDYLGSSGHKYIYIFYGESFKYNLFMGNQLNIYMFLLWEIL